MGYNEKTKVFAFSAIIALVGLLIIMINAHTLFPQLLFYSIVMVLICIIVVLVVHTFLWERARRYFSTLLWRRRMNGLAREYFEDFREFVLRFNRFHEFQSESRGITRILEDLIKKAVKGQGAMIQTRVQDFVPTLKQPLFDFGKRLDNLHWRKKEINYEFLKCLAKQFEDYVTIHKRQYIDFTVIKAREIRLDNLSSATRRLYSEYRDDYNQFVIAYTQFAKRSSKATLGIFSEHLQKANEL